MALIDDVQTICQRLARHGWRELLLSHGLDIRARDLEQELSKNLPHIDRRLAGFEDFASEGRRGIEPRRPARSLLYHALASPNILVGADGEPLGAFPTLAEIKTIENYVFGVAPPSLDELQDELHKAFPGAPMAIVVFATEYRPGAQTVHRRHADLCFSRTGVARVGTAEPLYDRRARGFVPFVEEEERAFRVLPAQYAPYVAVQLKPANESLFGPMNRNLMRRVLKEMREELPHITPEYPGEQKDDAGRDFWVPLHKLFSGPECLQGFDLSVGLEAHHVNQKISRLHRRLDSLGHKTGWQESDWYSPPFRFTEGIAEFSQDPESGEGVLTPIVHERLVEPAEYKGKPLHFRVPPEAAGHPYYWDSGSSVHIYPEEFEGHYLVHRAPEYVNARREVDDGKIKDLNDEPNVVDIVKDGGYRALHYVDFTGDGWIEARCPELDNEFKRHIRTYSGRIAAYSVVTAVDFYPYCEQRELIEWWFNRVKQHEARTWRRPPLTLSDSRIAPNLKLKDADFRAEDDTVTAIVSLPAEPGVDRHLGRAATARHAHLPDAAASWFAPGWDTSLDEADGTMHLASYGLGSPFPEDAKLCAALSSVWPAVAPDAARSFSKYFPTVTPLTDEEVGIVGELPWDGVTGPRRTSHGDGRRYEYASYDHVDYVTSALAGRFTLALTGQVDTAEYEARILAIARACVALKKKLGSEKTPCDPETEDLDNPWRVLSFQTVDSDDRVLKHAEEEAGADRLVGDRRDRLYRIVFGRVEDEREHPGDHRKVSVRMSRIVKLFGGTVPQVLLKDEGKPWQAFKTD